MAMRGKGLGGMRVGDRSMRILISPQIGFLSATMIATRAALEDYGPRIMDHKREMIVLRRGAVLHRGNMAGGQWEVEVQERKMRKKEPSTSKCEVGWRKQSARLVVF
ncbi:hypothetical protein AMTR_s00111p00111780 [Amborella trichopoda]|uniref:Uncharacterized protein n=1 Tax=Amborella trichopoda TaxID=13333 RepID=W1NY79_AMBTC|nr:hypothetical protein AMTR_s00111p00111780 [Amborella trichopoda]